ncbi:MAG TPA: methionyl-tRNA formyltransferase [Kineosporiaceae bacterium]|nr:methionyl-tRNA formyltransferase [Kineosporiaceae bacterium]
MRLVFAGTPAAAIPSLEAIAASRHELAAVVTRPDAPAGRGRRPAPSAVAQWADAAGVRVLQPAKPSEPGFLAELGSLAPDCCPVVAYGALVPRSALDVPRHGWVNLHFSLLPAWRGAAPVQRAIMAGDEVTGATTFRLERGLDTGPVFGVLTEPIRPADTAGDLLDRLSRAGAGLLVATLDGIEDGVLVPVPQPAEGVCLAPKVTVDEARIDWTQPYHVVNRRIRGCTPAPGAWTTFRDERVKIGPLRRGLGPRMTGNGMPDGLRVDGGELVQHVNGTGFVLGDVQPEGKRMMPATDWARGARIAPGERFE